MTSDLMRHWGLDTRIEFLNHGSFGACPATILARQQELRSQLEREPVHFMTRQLEPLMDAARFAVAEFVGADPEDLVFVRNATTGVNTVLRSLTFEPGDELLTTDHAYNACRNAFEFVAAQHGVRTRVVPIPLPIAGPGASLESLLEAVGPRTRLALVDHVSSSTGIIFPVAGIVTALQERGVRVLIDGAHAPGMLPLGLAALGADYYAANCHKWLCAPKGAGFLYVRRDRQAEIRPLVISHGATSQRTDRSRFRCEFDWMGTEDPTAYCTLPDAIRIVGSFVPGGWPEIMARNHALAVAARDVLCTALDIVPPCPASMLGSLASVPLPPGDGTPAPLGFNDIFQKQLWERGFEVPVMPWPRFPQRLLRISAQLYNSLDQYERLAQTVAALL